MNLMHAMDKNWTKNIDLRKEKAREGNEEVCTHFLDSESELQILSIRTLTS